MADLLIDNETLPATPASGKSVIFADSTSKKLAQLDDQGVAHGILSCCFPPSGTASQTTLATETYITNSGILIPAIGIQVGMLFRWYLNLFRATSTGTVAPIYKIYLGANQSVSDTLIATITAGTAPVSATAGGLITVAAFVRTVGASAVICPNFISGLNLGGVGQLASTVSATFNSAPGGTIYMGLSVTPGTSTTYTIDSVRGELIA